MNINKIFILLLAGAFLILSIMKSYNSGIVFFGFCLVVIGLSLLFPKLFLIEKEENFLEGNDYKNMDLIFYKTFTRLNLIMFGSYFGYLSINKDAYNINQLIFLVFLSFTLSIINSVYYFKYKGKIF